MERRNPDPFGRKYKQAFIEMFLALAAVLVLVWYVTPEVVPMVYLKAGTLGMVAALMLLALITMPISLIIAIIWSFFEW